MVGPSGWARLNLPARTTWNIWPQARGLERMGFMEQIGDWTYSANCLQLTILSNISNGHWMSGCCVTDLQLHMARTYVKEQRREACLQSLGKEKPPKWLVRQTLGIGPNKSDTSGEWRWWTNWNPWYGEGAMPSKGWVMGQARFSLLHC